MLIKKKCSGQKFTCAFYQSKTKVQRLFSFRQSTRGRLLLRRHRVIYQVPSNASINTLKCKQAILNPSIVIIPLFSLLKSRPAAVFTLQTLLIWLNSITDLWQIMMLGENLLKYMFPYRCKIVPTLCVMSDVQYFLKL